MWLRERAEETDVTTKVMARIGGIRTEHELPRSRSSPVCCDDKIIVIFSAVGKAYMDFSLWVVLVVLSQTGDGCTKAMRYVLSLLSEAHQDAHQITAHDLEFRGEALLFSAGFRRCKQCLCSALGVDKLGSWFANYFGTDGRFDAHLLHDGNALSAEIELLTSHSDLICSLDEGDFCACLGEPRCKGWASDAAANDEDFKWFHFVKSGWCDVL
ncbi:hypothetical protein HG531_000955 [Fusarium graminearum]|nr:hypothetical protein HG531_000955 [Fusarium graminearum]